MAARQAAGPNLTPETDAGPTADQKGLPKASPPAEPDAVYAPVRGSRTVPRGRRSVPVAVVTMLAVAITTIAMIALVRAARHVAAERRARAAAARRPQQAARAAAHSRKSRAAATSGAPVAGRREAAADDGVRGRGRG